MMVRVSKTEMIMMMAMATETARAVTMLLITM